MSGQRRFSVARCEGCGLHVELCVCASRPRVELGFSLIVVQNSRERHKPTNTGRQVVQSVVGAELLVWGELEPRREGLRPHAAAFDTERLLRPGIEFRLIFPRVSDPLVAGSDHLNCLHGRGPDLNPELAPMLAREHITAASAVVLLDGTWAQCSRMSRRVPVIARMPAYRLPDGPDSHWGVRTASEPSRISTYEAAVRVLEIAGELAAASAMQAWFDLHSARMQFIKGRRRTIDVPQEWLDERLRRFGPDPLTT